MRLNLVRNILRARRGLRADSRSEVSAVAVKGRCTAIAFAASIRAMLLSREGVIVYVGLKLIGTKSVFYR